MTDTKTKAALRRLEAREEHGATIVDYDSTEFGRGPFGMLFGGLIGGACADEASRLAPRHPLTVSVYVDYLRPTTAGAFSLKIERERQGRSMSWFAAETGQNGKLTARIRVIQAAPRPLRGLPSSAWAQATASPSELPEASKARPLDGPWLGDVLDYRADEKAGVLWFGHRDPAALPLGAAAFAVAMADYAAGVSRPDSWDAPAVLAFPNPQLSVALMREPKPGWVGLRPRSVWHAEGYGIAGGDLLDEQGVFGITHQTNVLMPLSAEKVS